jgi:nitrous oxidase accessory protein NosD
MKARRTFFTKILISLFIFLSFALTAQAETTQCTPITHLPFIISTQGIYCLVGHLDTNITTGAAIAILTNNVVLDLNGFKIGGLAAGPGTQAAGIAAYQKKNITVRNGTVRGFYNGVFLEDAPPYITSQGHLIEGIRADMNTTAGILVHGRGNIIRDNQVVDTGGTATSTNHSTFGIDVWGPGARVIHNSVYQTVQTGTGMARGIYVAQAPGSVVEKNKIGNMDLVIGTATSHGIRVYESLDVLVASNIITRMHYGINYDLPSTGKYRDNLTQNVSFSYTGGTDAGNND